MRAKQVRQSEQEKGNRLLISPRPHQQRGWEDSFNLASASIQDDLLLDITEVNDFDDNEWEW